MLMELPPDKRLYRAMLDRDSEFDGVFWFGVTTTGIFCRPTCPAKKPQPENVEFFSDVQQAVLAGYRPCRRCRPLDEAGAASEIVETLVDAVEARPDHRWQAADVRELGIDPATARRHFKDRFGMSFVAYARARRLSEGFRAIRDGASVIEGQLDAGFESGSGFRDAFSRYLGAPPVRADEARLFHARWIDTPVGAMLAVAEDAALLLLEFTDCRGLERELIDLRKRESAAILPGTNAALDRTAEALSDYFAGRDLMLDIPLRMTGTPFQENVWQALSNIPPGRTRSYSEVARSIGKPDAARAVARANGANKLALVIPCHRVIRDNGDLAGYAGGVWRKRWLLDHEAANRGAAD